jgi:GR25 family glycosyltransferase involved in LPS biosynthesis
MAQPSRVYWINLDTNVTRREHMTISLTRMGFLHTRVSGLYPDIFPPVHIPPPLRVPSGGELGCTLSHLKALWTAISEHKKLQYDDDEYFYVMEDDVVFPYAVDLSKIIQETIPTDKWDVLQLATNNPNLVPFLYEQVYLAHRVFWTPWIKYNYSTLCYAIKYNTAKQILLQYHFFNTGKMVSFATFQPLDTISFNAPISDLLIYHGFKSFTITVPILHALDHESHIHPQHLDMHKDATKHTHDIMQRMDYQALIYPFSMLDFESALPALRSWIERSNLKANEEHLELMDLHIEEDVVFPAAIHWDSILSKAPVDWTSLYIYTQSVSVAQENVRKFTEHNHPLWVPWVKKYKGGACTIVRMTQENTKKYVLCIPVAYREDHDKSARDYVEHALGIYHKEKVDENQLKDKSK